MIREETLCKLLRVVFERKTVSLIPSESSDDQYVLSYTKGLINDCTYTSKYLDRFLKLFQYAFIDPEPKEIRKNLIVDFDRQCAMERTIFYLKRHEIYIEHENDDQTKCRKIYDFISRYYLPAVFTNNSNESVEKAKKKECAEELLKAYETAGREFNNLGYSIPNHKKIVNKCYSDNFDEKSKYTSFVMKYACEPIFQHLKDLYGINICYPVSDINSENKSNSDKSLELSRTDWLGEENITLHQSSIIDFDYKSQLDELYEWECFINVDKKTALESWAKNDIMSAYSAYWNELENTANNIIEKSLKEKMKPLYENACSYLEKLIKNIIELKTNYRKETISEDELNELVEVKADCIIFTSDLIKMQVDTYDEKHRSEILFCILQNLIVTITGLINTKGEDIAESFHEMISKEMFGNHKKIVKQVMDSKDLDYLCKIENNYCTEHCDDYRTPNTFNEFFLCKKKKVMYLFKAALDAYYIKLKNQK